MPFDIFIFLIPALITIFVYYIFKTTSYSYILSYISFIVAFIGIFIVTFNQTNITDTIEMKKTIKNIYNSNIEDNNDTVNLDILTYINKTTTNSISNYSCRKIQKDNQDIIVIQYNEELLNGILILKNRFYFPI